jgi:hypothetical protein
MARLKAGRMLISIKFLKTSEHEGDGFMKQANYSSTDAVEWLNEVESLTVFSVSCLIDTASSRTSENQIPTLSWNCVHLLFSVNLEMKSFFINTLSYRLNKDYQKVFACLVFQNRSLFSFRWIVTCVIPRRSKYHKIKYQSLIFSAAAIPNGKEGGSVWIFAENNPKPTNPILLFNTATKTVSIPTGNATSQFPTLYETPATVTDGRDGFIIGEFGRVAESDGS